MTPRAERLPAPFATRTRTFVVVTAVALLLRAIVIAELADAPFTELLLGDAGFFHERAVRIAAGDLLGTDVFQAPLYPYVLGWAYALFGAEPFVARVLQALLGAVGCGLVAVAVWRFFSPRTGVLAGCLLAAHAPSVWMTGLLQKPTLTFFLTAVGMFALAQAEARAPQGGGADAGAGEGRGTRAGSFFAGAALGLLAWTRQNAALLVPIAAVWATGLGRRPLRWRAAGLLVLGALVAAAPFVARNVALTGSPLVVTGNLGVNLWTGNNPRADGLYAPLVPGRSHPDYEEADARRLAERAAGRPLEPDRVSAFWSARAREWARSDPLAWLTLLGRKAYVAANRVEVMDAEAFEAHRDRSHVLRWLGAVAHFGTLLAFATLGLWTTRGRWRELWLFHASLVALGAGLVLFFVTARFRLALVPWLAPFAAEGVYALTDALGRRRAREVLAGIAVLSVVAFVTSLPVDQGGDPRAATWNNVARELLQEGRAVEAERWASEALRLEPRNASAHFNLAVALGAEGRLDEARGHFEEAVSIEPELAAAALSELGAQLATRGALDEARRSFEESIAIDPGDADTHYRLGLLLRQSGDDPGAERSYLAALRVEPGHPEANNNVGVLLEWRGDVDEAIRHYTAAADADPTFVLPRVHLARIRASHADERLRDGAEAVRLAERALALDERVGQEWGGEVAPDLLDVLAAAYAEAGRFEEAVRAAERALAAARADGFVDDLVPGIEARLAGYRAGRPYRMAP